jgi:hypothetical protein
VGVGAESDGRVPIKAQQAASVRLADCQMTSAGGTGSGRDSPARLVSTRRLWFGLSGALEVVCVGRGLGLCSFAVFFAGENDGQAVSGLGRIDVRPHGNARDGATNDDGWSVVGGDAKWRDFDKR